MQYRESRNVVTCGTGIAEAVRTCSTEMAYAGTRSSSKTCSTEMAYAGTRSSSKTCGTEMAYAATRSGRDRGERGEREARAREG
eukprot:3121366-Rhodomonas_salina.4